MHLGIKRIDRLDQHNAYVKRVTPETHFHITELSEGWGALCKLLRMPIPAEPFPRVNDAEAIDGLAWKILKEAGSRVSGSLRLK